MPKPPLCLAQSHERRFVVELIGNEYSEIFQDFTYTFKVNDTLYRIKYPKDKWTTTQIERLVFEELYIYMRKRSGVAQAVNNI